MIDLVGHLLTKPGGLLDVLASQSSTLVAVGDSGNMSGSIYMLPPGNVLTSLADNGFTLSQVIKVAMSVVRIKAIAIEPRVRMHGLGRALISCGTQLYQQAGYSIVYGSFYEQLGLASFYEKCGFTVLSLGAPLPLEPFVGISASIQPGPGERIFVDLLNDSST